MAGRPKRRARGDKPAEWGRRDSERAERARARVEAEGGTFEEEAYRWPAFAEGHELSMVHGASSERRLAPVAEAFEETLGGSAPWTARGAFASARRSWAWAEAKCELYRRHFAEVGLFDERGEPRRGLESWERAEASARNARERLGLDPSSLAKLLGSLAAVAVAGGDDDGLAALKLEGAEIVKARRAQLTERSDSE
jgi:hypothetical protein